MSICVSVRCAIYSAAVASIRKINVTLASCSFWYHSNRHVSIEACVLLFACCVRCNVIYCTCVCVGVRLGLCGWVGVGVVYGRQLC